MQNKKQAVAIVSGIFLSFTVAIGLFVWSDRGHQKKVHDLEVAIAQAEGNLTKLREQTAQINEREVAQTLHSVASTGNEVAKLQNQYANTGLDANAVKNVGEKLATFFMEEVKGSGRTPWYMPANPDVRGKWMFLTQYGYVGSEVDAVWVFQDERTQDMLAYAIGIYNSESKAFSQIKVKTTYQGVRGIGVSPNPPSTAGGE